MQHCIRHNEEPGADLCRSCHNTYCHRCLVYAFGQSKPPYCVGCALVASGVRNNSVSVAQAEQPSRRAERARRKADKVAAKAAAKAAKRPAPKAPEGPAEVVPAPRPTDGVVRDPGESRVPQLSNLSIDFHLPAGAQRI